MMGEWRMQCSMRCDIDTFHMPRHAETCRTANLILLSFRHCTFLQSTMRTSSKAAIAAAVVASWHRLGDGGAVVSAFVVPTGARAHLASKASTSRMMVGLVPQGTPPLRPLLS